MTSVNDSGTEFVAFEYLAGLNERMEQAIEEHVQAISKGEYAAGIEQLNLLVLTGIAKSMYFMKTSDEWPEMVDGAIANYSARESDKADWICGADFSGLNARERQRVQTRAYSRVTPARSYTSEEFIDGIIDGTIRVRPLLDPLVQKDKS